MTRHNPGFPLLRRSRLAVTSLVVGLTLSTFPDQNVQARSEVRLQPDRAQRRLARTPDLIDLFGSQRSLASQGQTALSIAPSELKRFAETFQSSFDTKANRANRHAAWTQWTPTLGRLAAAEDGKLTDVWPAGRAWQLAHSGPSLAGDTSGENFSLHLDHADVKLKAFPSNTLAVTENTGAAAAVTEGSTFRSWLLAQSGAAQASQAPAGTPATPQVGGQYNDPKHGNLGNIGAKLADPTSNIWSLAMNFQGPQFFDGDLNTGDPEVGGGLILQPVMPFPMYGTGEDEWKLITRPVIPILFSQPSPTGFDRFTHRGGLGDIQLPLLLNPSPRMTGNFIFGAGPVWEFPTSTTDTLGSQQFSVGPAVVAGYKNKFLTAALFPNYFWGFADRSDRKSSTPTTSKLSLLYVLIFNLPDAWQIGMNPTISYNDKAPSGNKWNVPIGLFGAKTTLLGGVPVNIKLGLEYSVVSSDLFGKRAQIRLQVSPVIPGLMQNPLFGG